MSGSKNWCSQATEIITNIDTRQRSEIEGAAAIAAASISSGHATFLFGSGHSIMPVEEMYPRYGGLVGFIPMLELPLSFFTTIVGNMGFSQFDYLENNAEYGSRIFESYVMHPEDSLVAFTHSGSTPVTLEIAIRFKEIGAKVIGVTSKSRCMRSKSKHPSGKTLLDVADILIDTGVPDGDASVNVGGSFVGPLSSIGALTVSNLLSIETVKKLNDAGETPLVNPVRAFDPDADAKMKKIVDEYRRLLARHIYRADS